MELLSNIFRKKQTATKPKPLSEKKNAAFLVYFEMGPNLRIERSKRLYDAFPEIEDYTRLTWINEFINVNKKMWEFAYRYKQTKYKRETFYIDFKKIYPWMNEEAIKLSFSRTGYYVAHEGLDK